MRSACNRNSGLEGRETTCDVWHVVLHEHVTLAAGLGNGIPADPGIRVRVGEDVVDAVAVVAARRHHEAVDQQRLPVDGIDEVGDCRFIVDRPRFQDDFTLVAGSAGLVEVELVGSGFPVGGRKNVVSTVAVRAGCGVLIALCVPLPVDALVVFHHLIGVAPGAGAIQLQPLSVVVGRVFEILLALVAVGAEQLGVDRLRQDLLVHEQLELFAALRIGLELLVFVATEAVHVVVLVPELAGTRFTRRVGGGEPAGENSSQKQTEENPFSHGHESRFQPRIGRRFDVVVPGAPLGRSRRGSAGSPPSCINRDGGGQSTPLGNKARRGTRR
jgi:hypothetical protein